MVYSSKKQRQMIKIAQRQLGIDDDTYREILQHRFGVGSSTKLSSVQAGVLIEEFKKKGFAAKNSRPFVRRRPRQSGNVVRLASIRELEKIDALSHLIKWRVENGFEKWTLKRFGIQQIRTATEAWKVIEGLKKMFANQMKAEFGPAWMVKEYDDAGINRFIQEHA